MITDLKPYYALDIDVSTAIRADFDKEAWRLKSNYTGTPVDVWYIAHNQLNTLFTDEWLAYIKDLGIVLGGSLLFYRAAHYVHPGPHIDTHKETGLPTIMSLNFTVDFEDDSEMIWYDLPTDPGVAGVSPHQTPYTAWSAEYFDNRPITHRRCIGREQLTLVDTSRPHNILVGTKERWAVSIRIPTRFQQANGIEDWASAVEFFKPYIKAQS